ncbi:MAG: hypothetical protein J6V13_03800 [Paludibacteraceae bacterium]|nr:hypothetical protein [Paludibacteraceae bacterium]
MSKKHKCIQCAFFSMWDHTCVLNNFEHRDLNHKSCEKFEPEVVDE